MFSIQITSILSGDAAVDEFSFTNQHLGSISPLEYFQSLQVAGLHGSFTSKDDSKFQPDENLVVQNTNSVAAWSEF